MATEVATEENSCRSSNNGGGQSSSGTWNGREVRGVMFGAAIGGFCCRCLLHPVDTAKAMMQAQTSSKNTSSNNTPHLQQYGGRQGGPVLGEFVAGGAAGFAAPAAPGRSRAASVRYKQLLHSTYQALSTVWRREGIPGLYRGFCICGFGSIPATCMYFTSYYLFAALANDAAARRPRFLPSPNSKTSSSTSGVPSAAASSSEELPLLPADQQKAPERAEQQKERPQEPSHQQQNKQPSAAVDLLSGFAAEAISCVLWVPIDVCKERLQTQRVLGVYNYRGSLDCMHQICSSSGGVRELYKGYGATLLAFGPLSALFFMFDNQLKSVVQRVYSRWRSSSGNTNVVPQQQLQKKEEAQTRAADLQPLPAWAAGGCAMVAAAAAAWLTAPLDKVKLRIQVQRAAGGSAAARQGAVCVQTPYNYRSVSEGLKEMYVNEGLKGLFRASGARVAFHSGNFALLIALLECFKNVYLQYVEPLPAPARSLA